MKKRTFKYIFFLIILIIIIGFVVYGYNKINTPVKISTNSISLLDKDGNVFFQGNGNSKWIPLEEISKNIIDATISTEDKNFYKHFGFDIPRIIKASYTNIINRKTMQGASTISQQYAKNLFLDFEKTWERKWDEMWLTLNIEYHYSKEEILEGYLNTINYGHGMYGIEKASNYYYNKKASDLTLPEAAMLAGIPKSPSNYSPLVNENLAKNRQISILKNMKKNKYINDTQLNDAINEKLNFYGKETENNSTTVMYYKDAVFSELENINEIPKSILSKSGIKVYTELDMEAQSSLEKSIKVNIKDENMQASGIVMSSDSGAINGLIGGVDYTKSQYNRAVSSLRQVGSTMKPFLYYAALESGFTSSTSFTSEKTTFTFSNNQTYSPQNASEIYGNKAISLATAIAYSENIYAVKTHMFLGEQTLVNISKRLGINSKIIANPSLALGTNEISMYDMTSAYASFSNGGYKIIPHLITKVEDKDGNTIYSFKKEKEPILNSSLVYITNELLTSTYDSSFIDYNYPTLISLASRMSRKYSIKSGTTATDLWTIGYTPEIVTSIWVGYDDNINIKTKDYSCAKNIWIDVIEEYLKGKEKTWFEKPSNVVGILVDPITGIPATEESKNKKILYYLKGTEPTKNQLVFDEKIIP